ncbi:hypothetical protein ACFL5X_00445 [Candidatus Omnitrophota bacterium]
MAKEPVDQASAVKEPLPPVIEEAREQTPESQPEPLSDLTAYVPEAGLSITLPAGWKQGKPLAGDEEKFAESQDGAHFFESAHKRYPYASIEVFSRLDPDLTLQQYASSISYGTIISKTKRTVSGLEAIEIIEEDVCAFATDEELPIVAIHLYIQSEDKIILASVWALKEDFDARQPSLRTSLDSVSLSR